jgi:hypothetical protein
LWEKASPTPFGFLGAIAIDAGQPLPAKIWNAPEKREVNAPVKVERIEWVIVDHPRREISIPPTRSGTNL